MIIYKFERQITMKKVITLIAFAASITVNFANAQNIASKPDTATLNFIMNASIGGMQEIVSSNVAEKKSKNTDLKSYAAMMITDHTKANAQLMQLVIAKGYQMPPQATEKLVPNAVLTENSGDSFDRVYADLMVADHQATVSIFQNYAAVGKDPEIKAFAQQTLPTLKEHMAAIKAIAKKVKPAYL